MGKHLYTADLYVKHARKWERTPVCLDSATLDGLTRLAKRCAKHNFPSQKAKLKNIRCHVEYNYRIADQEI